MTIWPSEKPIFSSEKQDKDAIPCRCDNTETLEKLRYDTSGTCSFNKK